MVMHRDLRMRNVLVAKMSSDEFRCMILNYNISLIVTYITDDKSWKRCCVLLEILSLCLKVLSLEDRNPEGMDKLYYYSRMTNI